MTGEIFHDILAAQLPGVTTVPRLPALLASDMGIACFSDYRIFWHRCQVAAHQL
jgi:hypothetical protein